MWILKDFITDNILPLIPWTVFFLALVIFCTEFVWTERKLLGEKQKNIFKSLFACLLTGFITVYWVYKIFPMEKQTIAGIFIILPVLIFINNNFIKKVDIQKDWQTVFYISFVFIPLATKVFPLIIACYAFNCIFYLLAVLRTLSKNINKNIKKVDSKKIQKNKTLYGGVFLLSFIILLSLFLAYNKKSPITFLSSIVLDSIVLASFILWYFLNDKERIHWFTVFEGIFVFLPFLYNPFEHFWIGSAVTTASLVWIEYFSLIFAKKYKKDRFFLFSIGLEILSISLTIGIVCAGFHYKTIPVTSIIVVDTASVIALFLYYILFGTENYWIYTLLTVFLVCLSVFTSPFGEFYLVCTALCILLPLIIAAFKEHHWLLITELSGLLVSISWLCIMILSGQMDLDKIYEHVHIFGAITGKGMIQNDIIPFALKIGLVPALFIIIPLILELTFGIIIFIKRLKKH